MMPDIAKDVYTITARPDRIEETLLGIRRALQVAHSSEDFPKDLIEVRLQAERIDFNIQAQLQSNVRKISHIIPNYINVDGTFTRGDLLNYVEPRGMKSGNTLNINSDFYYIAGKTLNIKLRRQTPYFELGYWAYPDLSISAINQDWIVLGYPELIVEGAVEAVYRALGDIQNANSHQAVFYSLLDRLKSDAIYLGDPSDMSVLSNSEYDWGGQG